VETNLTVALASFSPDSDGIYDRLSQADSFTGEGQRREHEFRQSIARNAGHADLNEIGNYHSVRVMDAEVGQFLEGIPKNGLILDVGAGWGWHWRNLHQTRPDVTLVIVDFAKENLILARDLLRHQNEERLFLVQADARSLPFHISPEFAGFDGVWSVQTLQHVPEFESAVREIHASLKKGGVFWNYSLSVQPHIRLMKRALGRPYVTAGETPQGFWLERGSKKQATWLGELFHSPVTVRYSEFIFSPEIRFTLAGFPASRVLGSLDAQLSGRSWVPRSFARQISYHLRKVN